MKKKGERRGGECIYVDDLVCVRRMYVILLFFSLPCCLLVQYCFCAMLLFRFSWPLSFSSSLRFAFMISYGCVGVVVRVIELMEILFSWRWTATKWLFDFRVQYER